MVESYTLVPGRGSALGAIVGRGEKGERCDGDEADDDEAALGLLREGAVFGAEITVSNDERGRNIFAFAG